MGKSWKDKRYDSGERKKSKPRKDQSDAEAEDDNDLRFHIINKLKRREVQC